MINKKILIVFSIFLIFVMFSSSVSAVEDNNDTQALNSANIDETLTDDENTEILKDDDVGTFSDLHAEIEAGGNITLNKKNYIYNSDSDNNTEIKFTTSDSVIDGNGAIIDMLNYQNSTVFYILGSNVILKNLTIKNANVDNGVVFFHAEGTVENCNFINNTGFAGGAIFFSEKNHAEGTVKNCNFINNTQSIFNGAAIFMYHGSVDNCNFINNQVLNPSSEGGAGEGGAVYFAQDGIVTNSNFTSNKAACIAGALRIIGFGIVENCIFINNVAQIFYGGAICSQSSNLINCIFVNNTSGDHGGAVQTDYGNVTNCNFTNNSAGHYGGAIRFQQSGIVENSIFTSNTADNSECLGGAILFGVSGSVNKCRFLNNSAAKSGGAVYLPSGQVTNSIFKFNQADNGAGVYLDEGDVENCKFLNNTASLGGAIFFSNSASVNNSIFGYNVADDSGNAIYTQNLTGTVSNSKFSNLNETDAGNTMTFINCTFGYIPLIDTTITVNDVIANYTTPKEVIITLKDEDDNLLVGFNVSVDLNGIKNYTTDNNGQINISTSGIIPNTYVVNVYFEGNETYGASNATFKIIINKIQTYLSANSVITFYGVDDEIIINLKDADGNPIADFNVLVNFNGLDNYTTDKNGQIILSTKAITPGIHHVTAAFAGDEIYQASNATSQVFIFKQFTVFYVNDVTTSYGVSKNLIITLTDIHGNYLNGVNVSVDLNGVKNYKTDKNGRIVISLKNLVPKSYVAKITFSGNGYYMGTYTQNNVVVKKATPKFSAKSKKFKKSTKTKKYSITLKNNLNKAMKNTKVTIKVNKKTYAAKTNSKGVATFKITKLTKKGKFKSTITYGGSSYYNKVTKKVYIIVK